MDRHGAGRIVRRIASGARIGKNVVPHTLWHAFITAAQMKLHRMHHSPEGVIAVS